MAESIKVVIVTRSPVGSRILPRILRLPKHCSIEIVPDLETAETHWQNGSQAVLILDLRIGSRVLARYLALLDQGLAPPTLLIGEPWELPAELKGSLSERLTFACLPIDPQAINARVAELIERAGRWSAGRPADADQEAIVIPTATNHPDPTVCTPADPASAEAAPAEAEEAVTSVDELVGRLEMLLGVDDG